MLNFLFKTSIVVGTFGTLAFGFTMYNSGVRTLDQLQSKYSEASNVATALFTDAKLIQPTTYKFDLSDIQNKIRLATTLKVANLSSEQILKVHQTGARDTWVIGGFLKGNAYFDFKASFTGSVEYSTKEMTFSQEGKNLVVTLPTPIINLSDIKYAEISTTGNLSDIIGAKQNLLSKLETSAKNYNYSLFFNAADSRALVTQSANQAEQSLKQMIEGILKASNPNLDYSIIVRRANAQIANVVIQNGSGSDVLIPIGNIMNATVEPIVESLKTEDSSAQVTIQKVTNNTSPPN